MHINSKVLKTLKNIKSFKGFYKNIFIDQAKFAYFSLGKAFEKQTTTIREQGSKQVKTTERRGK